MKNTIPCSLCVLLLSAAAATVQSEARRDPAAIEIMERADRAIRQLGAVSFRSEYNGLFSARGRLVGDVTLRRGAGQHEVIGTTRYSARLDVTMIDPPWGHEAFPADYVLVEHDGRASLVDRNGKFVKVAEGFERMALNAATSTLVPPQFIRPDPMSVELEQSIGARYLGRASVDDTESDLVWLRCDETSGLGEQLLHFGVDDHLPRSRGDPGPSLRRAGRAPGHDRMAHGRPLHRMGRGAEPGLHRLHAIHGYSRGRLRPPHVPLRV